MPASPLCFILMILLFLRFQTGSTETLMCFKCDSNKDVTAGDCERKPPPLVRCDDTSGTEQFCLIAQEYDNNGQLTRFVRDCTTISYTEGCTIVQELAKTQGAPAKVCYTKCGTDACNSAPKGPYSLHMHHLWTLTVMLSAYIVPHLL